MSGDSLITVAIPTYLRDAYLKDALESVFAQTIADIEIIVSDNANSPATRALVESYRDSRVSYRPLPENIGPHGNLTRCLHLGSAGYIAVLLDDDTMYPQNLETKIALLDEYPTAGVAHAAFDYVDQAGQVTVRNVNWAGGPDAAPFETGREFIERTMATGNRIATSSAVIRRPAVLGLCHDHRDGGFSDLGLWLRIASRYDFAFSSGSLTTVRLHAGSVSSELGLHESGEGDISLSTFSMTSASRSAKLRFIEEHDLAARDRSFLGRARQRSGANGADKDARCQYFEGQKVFVDGATALSCGPDRTEPLVVAVGLRNPRVECFRPTYLRHGCRLSLKVVTSRSLAGPPALISVVLCCHNGGRTLNDQLTALSKQDYAGLWELVFVDDRSTDDSVAIAESWSDRLPLRIVPTRLTGEPVGLAQARNIGGRSAHGEVLLFCDDDDVADSGWISAFAKAAEKSAAFGGFNEEELLNEPRAREWRYPLTPGHLPIAFDKLAFPVGNNSGVGPPSSWTWGDSKLSTRSSALEKR